MTHKKTSIWFSFGFTITTVLIAVGLFFSSIASAQVPATGKENTQPIASLKKPTIKKGADPAPSSDDRNAHQFLEKLQRDFETPQEVTKACISCHENSAQEVMHTSHWTWKYVNETTGQTLGKKNEINNFCVATSSNESRCTSCHVGYGWKDDSFDFSVQENVDCLVCHDTTGTYIKSGAAAGFPAGYTGNKSLDTNPVDLTYVAQNVNMPGRDNCLVCHAYGGGGDGVKHGDIDSSLKKPDFALDVHMDAEKLNFSCTECHVTKAHAISGSRYQHDKRVKTCVDCHDDRSLHKDEILNKHSEKLACQSCHIPEYARGGIPTKMTWDWSTAGQFTDDGQKIRTKEYNSLKGSFTLAENVIPDYIWFNGTTEYTLVSETIDPSQIISVNRFKGDINDSNAKIVPVKRFTGKIPYDSGKNVLVVPHLFGKDDAAYWNKFDWNASIAAGMKNIGANYSGEYDFAKTEFFWFITHMVAPATEALQCRECHDPKNERIDFAALGYDKEQSDKLTWEFDEYPKISAAALDELVSHPVQSNDWKLWLVGIIAVFGFFEIAGTRHIIRREKESDQKNK